MSRRVHLPPATCHPPRTRGGKCRVWTNTLCTLAKPARLLTTAATCAPSCNTHNQPARWIRGFGFRGCAHCQTLDVQEPHTVESSAHSGSRMCNACLRCCMQSAGSAPGVRVQGFRFRVQGFRGWAAPDTSGAAEKTLLIAAAVLTPIPPASPIPPPALTIAALPPSISNNLSPSSFSQCLPLSPSTSSLPFPS